MTLCYLLSKLIIAIDIIVSDILLVFEGGMAKGGVFLTLNLNQFAG